MSFQSRLSKHPAWQDPEIVLSHETRRLPHADSHAGMTFGDYRFLLAQAWRAPHEIKSYGGAENKRGSSFDHLVGTGEQRRWHFEAERSRRFEVDDQLVLRWRLHRQIGWLLAFQDAIDVTRRAPVLIDEIRPVGDQAATADIKTGVVDDRQSVP